MKNTNLIPTKVNGGQTYNVFKVERCNNNAVGISSYCGGFIEIADFFDKDSLQGEGIKVNTFFHELIHIILENMGEKDLSANEKFVCTFAGFLTEAMTTAKYETNEIGKTLKEVAAE